VVLFHGMPILAYCATLNNYTPADVAVLRTPSTKLAYIIVGHEVGATGTPHLQIYFQLEKQCKMSTIKNWGGPWGRMHFEAARGTDVEASDYCKKDGNFFELGSRKTMGRKGARNDLESVKESITEGKSYDDICDEHFNQSARYHTFIRQRVQARDSKKQEDSLRESLSSSVLRPWQAALLAVTEEEACPRKIHWVWEEEGNKGKSWMATYLGVVKGALVLTAARKLDLTYIYAKNPKKVVIFDLTRTAAPDEDRKKSLDGIYSLAEELKNGHLVSTKYEPIDIYFRSPHVIFLANFEPDYTKWSGDRYFVTKLT